MIFPRGEIVHKNLSTAFTDLSALLSTLKTERFSGTVELTFPGVKGLFFFDSGEIIHVEAKLEVDSKPMGGQEAHQTLLSLSEHKDGLLSVYRLSHERAALIAGSLENEAVFKELSTNFTRLDRLLLKLREEKHLGFIEILSKDHQAMGVLFLEGGEPVEMFTTPESGPSVFGRKSIPIFVENATKQGAVFNVFRTSGRMTKEKVTAPEKGPAQERVAAQEKMATQDRVAVQEKPAVQPKATAQERPLAKEKPAGETRVFTDEKPAPKAGGKGLEELLPILEEVLSGAENLVDGTTQKGTFLKAFKKSLIEKSEPFDFLDPFAGEFEYRDGTVRFIGEAGQKELAKGIVESLRTTLSHLEREFPKDKMLPIKLRAEIESSLERHNAALKRLGVDAIFSSFSQ